MAKQDADEPAAFRAPAPRSTSYGLWHLTTGLTSHSTVNRMGYQNQGGVHRRHQAAVTRQVSRLPRLKCEAGADLPAAGDQISDAIRDMAADMPPYSSRATTPVSLNDQTSPRLDYHAAADRLKPAGRDVRLLDINFRLRATLHKFIRWHSPSVCQLTSPMP